MWQSSPSVAMPNPLLMKYMFAVKKKHETNKHNFIINAKNIRIIRHKIKNLVVFKIVYFIIFFAVIIKIGRAHV